jgi:hypothetical protein
MACNCLNVQAISQKRNKAAVNRTLRAECGRFRIFLERLEQINKGDIKTKEVCISMVQIA